jgi:hypothetical protein
MGALVAPAVGLGVGEEVLAVTAGGDNRAPVPGLVDALHPATPKATPARATASRVLPLKIISANPTSSDDDAEP